MKNNTISLQNISKKFLQGSKDITVFENISCSFKEQSYALTGTSGSGKSTLIHLLTGIENPSSGTILLNNTNLSELSLNEKAILLQQSIGIIFQQPLLIPELTVLENIMIKAITHTSIKQQDISHAKQLLSEVNLLDKAYCTPNTLSGGQQQRVAILRALFCTPQFLFADEPTGNLDSQTSKAVIDLLFYYQKKYNLCLVISTHDVNIAQQCNTIVKIENKKLSLHTQNN